jgi:hypothetical protein
LANPIEQIIGGFIGGLVAGITGYAIDLAIGTMFEAFQSFIPLFAVYGVVFAIVSFLSGLMKAYYAGFFFSIGIISAGFLLNNFVTTVSGVISISGIVISLFKK